ncbi:Protein DETOXIFICATION 40 [Camellia lanceoleosa]|uniref:Protein DETOXIFICATION 40 n=1 Tax=Camellia lanceoleosa TaxID=1840588 RepID=A0ACC0H0D7_9ERIC|nr:Protein DETOXIFICATION 40 [Camellia lanceoleosa]
MLLNWVSSKFLSTLNFIFTTTITQLITLPKSATATTPYLRPDNDIQDGITQNDHLDPPSLQSQSPPPPLSVQSSSEKHMELSSQLETILSDKEVPLFHHLQSATWIELKLLFKLAAPAIFVCMVSFGMSTSTQIFSGHLGDLELAAASLRNNGIQMFAYVMICLESWYYQIVLLLAGLLPNPKLALDSLSICLLIAGCIMMISIGFNAAVSVRVSNELGAGHGKSATFSVAVVNLVFFILCLIAAIVVLALCNGINYAFMDGEIVARAVSELCPLLAFSLILNGIQPLVWNMVMIAGTLVQSIILVWVTCRTDWKKEVEKATRLEK